MQVVAMGAIDPQTLANLRDIGDSDFLAEVIGIYLTDAPVRLKAMRSALADRDPARFAREAHRLRGGSGNIGARAVVALCEDLEATVIAGSFEGVEQKLDRLQDAYDRAARELARTQHSALSTES